MTTVKRLVENLQKDYDMVFKRIHQHLKDMAHTARIIFTGYVLIIGRQSS